MTTAPGPLSPSGSTGFADSPTAPGPMLASGRWADIFIVDDHRLLRRNRYTDVGQHEVQLLRHVVAQGFPAPMPLEVRGRDLVLERLHGPTLLQSLAAGETSLAVGGQVLAKLQSRLHTLVTPVDSPRGAVIVHLDIHPANVILTEERGPMLIDWTNVALGNGDVDLAISAVILAEVAVDSDGEYSRAARTVLTSYLATARGDVLAGLDEAAHRRQLDPSLEPDEQALVPAAAALVRRLGSL